MKILNQALITLFAINLAIGLTSQLVQPLFPLYLKETGATELENALVISIGNLSSAIFMLPAGMLVGKYGKRTFLIISAVISGLSVLLMAYTKNWMLIIPLNMLLNISMCFFMPTRMAIIAENTDPGNRASLFGVMNLAWPISGIVGPIAGGYLVEHLGWSSVFIIAGAISLIALFPALKIIESKKEVDIIPETRDESSIFNRNYLPTMLTLFTYQVLVTTSMAGINMILPLYLQDRYHLSYSVIGAFFTGSNFLLIFTQLGGGIVADRYGRRRMILLCTALTPLVIGSWALFGDWMVLFAVYSLAFALWSLTWPPILAMLTDILPRSLHGAGFGLNMTGSRLGFTIGPILVGALYFAPGSVVPFIAAAVAYALALPFAYQLRREKPKQSNT
ncbi:MAG: MFS transporter [Candidatus Bathyarchaeota archaeon]|nr:MFS transporter [Candidatus Bathyarchaeota archaeon]